MYPTDPVSVRQTRNADLFVAAQDRKHHEVRTRSRGARHPGLRLRTAAAAFRQRFLPTHRATVGPLSNTHDLFRGLSQSQLTSLATYLDIRVCKVGESLGRQDEPATGMVIVLDAQIGVAIDGVPIAVLDDGSHFGSLPLIDGGEALHRASFDVLAPGTIAFLDKADFRTVLDRFPTVAIWTYAMARTRREYLAQLAACETSQSLGQSTLALLEYPVHIHV